MSIAVMSNVWRTCNQQGASLLVMLALSDWCDDAGECFPSVMSLAEKARITERAAYRIISRLEAVGEIEIDAGRGRGNSSRYRLPGYAGKPDRGSGFVEPKNLTMAPEKPDHGARKT